MPQVLLRTVSTRVPGLRPVRTSDTSTPAAASRARVASASATRQLRPHSRSRAASRSLPGRCTTSTIRSPQRKNISRPQSGCERSNRMSSPSRAPYSAAARSGSPVATTTWSIAVIEATSVCTDSGRSLVEFEEEQPDAARGVGRRTGPFPRQRGAGLGILALGLADRFGLERQPLQPAMHPADINGAKAQAGEPLALLRDNAANPIGGGAVAGGRQQLQRHVVEREQHAIGAVAAAAPRRRAREQRLVGRRGGGEVADQNDDVIEPADHGNSPRVFLAARTFSTPIAMAAVRCEMLSALERATIVSKARSRI